MRIKTKEVVCAKCGYIGLLGVIVPQEEKIVVYSKKSGYSTLPADATPTAETTKGES